PEVLTNFSDMVKPNELRIDGEYVYISDQCSVFVYDMKNFKLVKKLGNKGEGPQEFRDSPKITIASDRLILNSIYKIIIYSEDFKLIKEMNLPLAVNGIIPCGDNFILEHSEVIDNNKYRLFAVYNSKIEKTKDLLTTPIDPGITKILIAPWTVCRCRDDKVFIAQPHKGFYIDVFNKNGVKLYQIEKNVGKIRSEEKHRNLYMEEMLFSLGRRIFERARQRGVFKRPMREFLPSIGNFWVLEDRIYVKTYDITDTKQKYIIMDLKGNILKTVFLPRAYKEILTFSKNKFYYLEDREEEGWVLQALDLSQEKK
nr:hypothetical protein [Candidatus Aminicenantes bacterium]NIN40885.1 hypothetical protein [Candidatus Aminicenantes bacterium]